MAEDYEEVVRHWGYNMPESVVEALESYGNLRKESAWSMLDIGCGDGLCGKILKVLLVINISKIQYLKKFSSYKWSI